MTSNFYIKLGKLFIYKKCIYFLMLFLLLITSVTTFSSTKKYLKIRFYQNRLDNLKYLALKSLEERKKVKDFIEKQIDHDKFFIDNNLENLKFLQHEKDILDRLIIHPAFSNNCQIKKRLDFINSDQNILKFAEENVIQTSLVKETDENQINGIEIDEKDLDKILSVVESSQCSNSSLSTLNPPQLIIKNFMLSKKNETTFLLEMKILKREYLKKQKNV